MYYQQINKNDIANGPGVRVSLFVSGCRQHCKGCFNPETWDFNKGSEFTPSVETELLEALKADHITGLSLLGGDPMEPENRDVILRLVTKIHDKDIWLWTGKLWDDLINSSTSLEIIKHIDVLVDGPFIEEQKDLRLAFKGSSNQRIIDCKKSLQQNKTVLWEVNDDTVK